MTPWHEEAMLLRDRARKYIDAVHDYLEERNKEWAANSSVLQKMEAEMNNTEQMLEIGIMVYDNMTPAQRRGKKAGND